RLLGGERVHKPPFWEVWFDMDEFFRRRYGDPQKVENRVKMAYDLGMAAVKLGSVDINASFRRDEVASDGSSRYAGGSLTSLKQLEEREMPDWSDTVRRWKRDQRLIKDAGLVSWVVLPWCFHTVATSMGLESFVLKLYKDFEFVDAAFEWVEERNREAIDVVIKEVRPDFVLFGGDCAYKSGLMINPGLFRRLVFERTEETVSHLKRLNIPYTFHTDGKLDDVIPFLVELGFSAVHGCEKAANDLNHLIDEFGDDIVLVGNMDVVFLSKASPGEVRRETEEMLKIGSSKGKFVAACNTSPQDYIPEENYLAMTETIKSFDPLILIVWGQ
ncbi:MAG: uroporphyrinogen decarboxylase family protein, partial [Candidatus Bathyarchaeia archaeon]